MIYNSPTVRLLSHCFTTRTNSMSCTGRAKKNMTNTVRVVRVVDISSVQTSVQSPHLPCYSALTHEDHGCFPLCQKFLKFGLEIKWKGPFRFLPTRTLGITLLPLLYIVCFSDINHIGLFWSHHGHFGSTASSQNTNDGSTKFT